MILKDEVNKAVCMMVTMSIDKIRIPTMYTQTIPKKNKINKHMRYYVEHGQFKNNIVITQKGILINGYCDYIVAVACGMNAVQCEINTNKLRESLGGKRTTITRRQHKRKVIYKRQGGKCAICAKPLQNDDCTSVKDYMTLDHILPVIRGGSNALKNLQGLCETCNKEKGSKLI